MSKNIISSLVGKKVVFIIILLVTTSAVYAKQFMGCGPQLVYNLNFCKWLFPYHDGVKHSAINYKEL